MEWHQMQPLQSNTVKRTIHSKMYQEGDTVMKVGKMCAIL